MKLKLITVLFLFLSFSVYSDTRRGNGGFVVSCREKRLLSTLDTYEGIYKYGVIPSTTFGEVGFDQILNIFSWRYCKIRPSECLSFQALMDQFSSRYLFVTNVPLADVGSLNGSYQNCKLKQIAYRGNLGGANYLLIDYHLWAQLPIYEKSVLLLHEILFTHFLENRQIKISPSKLRDITYLISINELEGARTVLSSIEN